MFSPLFSRVGRPSVSSVHTFGAMLIELEKGWSDREFEGESRFDERCKYALGVSRIALREAQADMQGERDLALCCVDHIGEIVEPLKQLQCMVLTPIGVIDSAISTVKLSVENFVDNPDSSTFNAALTWITELPYVLNRSLGGILLEPNASLITYSGIRSNPLKTEKPKTVPGQHPIAA